MTETEVQIFHHSVVRLEWKTKRYYCINKINYMSFINQGMFLFMLLLSLANKLEFLN